VAKNASLNLIAIQIAEPHVAFLDEPTNHMDYIGKAAFVQWLKNTNSSVLVISHDRDVLGAVDRIIELKDRKAHSATTATTTPTSTQNASKTSNAINEYEITEKRIKNIKRTDRIRSTLALLALKAKPAKTRGWSCAKSLAT
jgi:ATP-binding cassette, subfamily F, member 3